VGEGKRVRLDSAGKQVAVKGQLEPLKKESVAGHGTAQWRRR